MKDSEKIDGWFAALLLLVFFAPFGIFLSVAVCQSEDEGRSQTSTSRRSEWMPSTSQKLAAMETNSIRGATDSVLSSRMQRRLDSLLRKFPETEDQIADMTVKAKELLEKRGVTRSLTDIMDGINYRIPSSELGVTYAESAALYVTAESR